MSIASRQDGDLEAWRKVVGSRRGGDVMAVRTVGDDWESEEAGRGKLRGEIDVVDVIEKTGGEGGCLDGRRE